MKKNGLENLSKVSDKKLLNYFGLKRTDKKDVAAPSVVWRNWLDRLAFLHTISIQEIRLHSGFGYLLGSPIEKDLWRTSRLNSLKNSNEEKKTFYSRVESLIEDIPKPFRIDEPDPARDLFSIKYKNIHVNTDTIRTQVDVNNLYKLGLLKNKPTILEIGGGYGQLAMALLRSGKINKYIIIDFPETLHIIARWTKHVMRDLPITLIKSDIADVNKVKTNGLILVPNNILFTKNNLQGKDKIETDVLININSFCEMTKQQVTSYLTHPNIAFKNLFSNNRDRQPDNKEIDNLLSIFKSIGSVWPERDDYKSFSNHEKIFLKNKFVHVVSKQGPFNSPCKVTDLYGFEGDQMPGMG
jgi:hypothetical protein